MKRFIEGENRKQVTLLAECLEDYVGADNPVRVVDVFVDQLELRRLGFAGVEPAETCAGFGRGEEPSTSTATSIESSPVAAWSAKPSATSS